MEAESVMANSRNNRPTTPPISKSGMKTAIRETVSETIVKPICRDPIRAACNGRSPFSMNRTMFSIMTIASSTMNPEATLNAINERLSKLKLTAAMTANVATSDTGKVTAG